MKQKIVDIERAETKELVRRIFAALGEESGGVDGVVCIEALMYALTIMATTAPTKKQREESRAWIMHQLPVMLDAALQKKGEADEKGWAPH